MTQENSKAMAAGGELGELYLYDELILGRIQRTAKQLGVLKGAVAIASSEIGRDFEKS